MQSVVGVNTVPRNILPPDNYNSLEKISPASLEKILQ